MCVFPLNFFYCLANLLLSYSKPSLFSYKSGFHFRLHFKPKPLYSHRSRKRYIRNKYCILLLEKYTTTAFPAFYRIPSVSHHHMRLLLRTGRGDQLSFFLYSSASRHRVQKWQDVFPSSQTSIFRMPVNIFPLYRENRILTHSRDKSRSICRHPLAHMCNIIYMCVHTDVKVCITVYTILKRF